MKERPLVIAFDVDDTLLPGKGNPPGHGKRLRRLWDILRRAQEAGEVEIWIVSGRLESDLEETRRRLLENGVYCPAKRMLMKESPLLPDFTHKLKSYRAIAADIVIDNSETCQPYALAEGFTFLKAPGPRQSDAEAWKEHGDANAESRDSAVNLQSP